MGGPFGEPPYPSLTPSDFGAGSPYQAAVYHGGGMVVIGSVADLMLQEIPRRIRPGAGQVDVAIHGLPGRFVETINSPRWEIPPPVVGALLVAAGIGRGSPLRLLACHAAEAPSAGLTAAERLAREWGAPVTGPNGLLRITRGGTFRVDLVDWEPVPWDPQRMQVDANTVRVGRGSFQTVAP